MIIRLLHLKVHPGKQAEFKHILELLLPYSIKTRSGMVALYPGQLQGTNSQEFVLVTVWKDQETMMSQTRRNWTDAVLPPEALPLVQEWHVSKYKSFGVMELPAKPLFKSI
jgi:quinol monooxygenase YgiN